MAEKNFSLKDQLFNAQSLTQLGGEYAAALPGFDADAFVAKALSGVEERSLMECLDWFADCLEPALADDFPTLAAQVLAAMPPPLDPTLRDDDFGRFIHAIPGILAVRHGLEDHLDQALDLLKEATKRFSMEFYIRAFLNRWPEETLARLALWAEDSNYHVRRLVSEGTRPKLPWARAITTTSAQALPFLTTLHGDSTRYVTRSVANHLNDIAKTDPDLVVATLTAWQGEGRQDTKELAWMTRHALRTLIKDGHTGALEMLGYRQDVAVDAALHLAQTEIVIGDELTFDLDLTCAETLPVMVDYRLTFARPTGKSGQKVFKLKAGKLTGGKAQRFSKRHKLKGNATTFRLHPGAHKITVQVNGVDVAEADFTLLTNQD